MFLNYDIVSSRLAKDRALYLVFCGLIAPNISRKYFQEVFAENYMNLIEDKQVAIQLAFLKSI